MGRGNNFTALTIVATGIVVYGNGLILTSAPPSGLWGAPMQRVGLDILFAVIGYGATGSWRRHGRFPAYVIGGLLRILPALAACVVVTIFIIGPLATQLSLRFYFLNRMTIRYLGNALLILQLWLPRVFEGQQWVGTVNPMLWTIVPGLFGCALIPLTNVLSVKSRLIALMACGLALGCLSLLWPLIVPGLPAFLSRPIFGDALTEAVFFVAGVILALAEDEFGELLWRADLVMLSFAATWMMASWLGSWTIVLEWFTVPYMAIAFGRMSLPGCDRLRVLGSPALGMYLYAFPFQQLIVQHFPGAAWSIPLCLALSLIAGVLSWFCIEAPVLSRYSRRRVAQVG